MGCCSCMFFFAKNLSGSCVGFRRISSKNQKFRRKTKNFVGIRRMIFLDFSVSDVNFLLGSWHIWTKATFCSLFSDARQPKRRKGELFDDLGRWYERSRCHRPPFPAQTSKFNWTVSVLSVVLVLDSCTCTCEQLLPFNSEAVESSEVCGEKMDLKQGSKTLSCHSLVAGQGWMQGQPQPRGGPPPVQAIVQGNIVHVNNLEHIFFDEIWYIYKCFKEKWNLVVSRGNICISFLLWVATIYIS